MSKNVDQSEPPYTPLVKIQVKSLGNFEIRMYSKIDSPESYRLLKLLVSNMIKTLLTNVVLRNVAWFARQAIDSRVSGKNMWDCKGDEDLYKVGINTWDRLYAKSLMIIFNNVKNMVFMGKSAIFGHIFCR